MAVTYLLFRPAFVSMRQGNSNVCQAMGCSADVRFFYVGRDLCICGRRYYLGRFYVSGAFFFARRRPILCACDVEKLIGFDARPSLMDSDSRRWVSLVEVTMCFSLYDGAIYIVAAAIIVSFVGLISISRRIFPLAEFGRCSAPWVAVGDSFRYTLYLPNSNSHWVTKLF